MIRITLEFASVDEAHTALHRLMGLPGAGSQVSGATLSQASERSAVPPIACPVVSALGAPRPRGRPRKNAALQAPAAAAPVSAAPVSAPVAVDKTPAPVASAAPTSTLTEDQRTKMLTDLYSVGDRGPQKALALLQRFGVSRLRNLPAENLPEFDKLAAQTLNGTFDPMASS